MPVCSESSVTVTSRSSLQRFDLATEEAQSAAPLHGRPEVVCAVAGPSKTRTVCVWVTVCS